MRAAVVLVLGLLLVVESAGRGRWVRRSRSGDDDDAWRPNELVAAAAPPLRKHTVDMLYGLTQPGTLKVRRPGVDLGGNHLSFASGQHDFDGQGPPQQQTGLPSTFINQASDEEVARFLNLLTLVRFANSECHSDEGLIGSCYPETECHGLGGFTGGSCANGFGVCCVFIGTCGEQLQANGSYFESPNYPELMPTPNRPRSCVFEIRKTNPYVTQLRIDFDFFELAGPTGGECQNDRLIISGQDNGSPVPPMCGTNSGQHVYFDLKHKRNPVRFTVITLSNMSIVANRRWRIRITQLNPRDMPLAAPSHCLQYYTAPNGIVQSFNYMGGAYTNNLNYAICIKKMVGACSITYRNLNVTGQESRFQLVNAEATGQSIVPANQAGAGVFNCPDDYIVVSGVRLCGEKLNDATTNIDFTVNAPVTDSSSGPFILPFRTNAGVVGRGFHLVYTQNACSLS